MMIALDPLRPLRNALFVIEPALGHDDLAFGPQNASDRLMERSGMLIVVPFGMVMLCNSSPDLLMTGELRGSISSCAACVRSKVIDRND